MQPRSHVERSSGAGSGYLFYFIFLFDFCLTTVTTCAGAFWPGSHAVRTGLEEAIRPVTAWCRVSPLFN